jgi:ABC-type multidrug transport system ATPase subunit
MFVEFTGNEGKNMDMSPAVKMADVKKSFGSVEAVRNISWEIPAGEIFGLLGPNGAGKTTTINMVSSLLEPDSGHLSVFGLNARRAGQTNGGSEGLWNCTYHSRQFQR